MFVLSPAVSSCYPPVQEAMMLGDLWVVGVWLLHPAWGRGGGGWAAFYAK